MWDMNLYNKVNDLPYLDLDRIHKDTGNRPLNLGQFFSFREFSLFYWLKLLKSIPFDKVYGLEGFLVKIVAQIWKNLKIYKTMP